jgi:hypothetical protein
MNVLEWIRSWFARDESEPAVVVPPPPDRLAINRVRAVRRARLVATLGSTYVLGAGGRNPDAPNPFTTRDGMLGCDCVGFTSWCLGHDRFQPGRFAHYDGWINTDSMIADARGRRTWYAPIARPEPGDVVVFPSITRDGKRIRLGHVGLVVAVPDEFPEAFAFHWPDVTRRGWLARVRVIDCAGSALRRKAGRAVAETSAAASWDKPDALFCRLVRGA